MLNQVDELPTVWRSVETIMLVIVKTGILDNLTKEQVKELGRLIKRFDNMG